MEKLRSAERWLTRLEGALIAGILTFMIGLSFAQVVLRQAFGSGLLWADTLLRHLVLWVGFLGAGVAAASGKHFALELTHGEPPPRRRLAVQLATAVLSALLLRAACAFLAQEKASGSVLFTLAGAEVPAWLLMAIVPLGFGLVAAHSLIQALLAAGELRR